MYNLCERGEKQTVHYIGLGERELMAVHYTGLVSLVLSDICSDDKFKEFSSVFCLCTVLIKIFFFFLSS